MKRESPTGRRIATFGSIVSNPTVALDTSNIRGVKQQVQMRISLLDAENSTSSTLQCLKRP